MPSLEEIATDLSTGSVSSRQLVESALARIEDGSGEGKRTFVKVFANNAIAEAEKVDQGRKRGYSSSPYAGIPLAAKDLFDIQGQVTTAGSRLLANADAANEDAVVIRRLREAGFIIIGRTNMTEFAFSGVGLNSHFGTPKNPYDRETGRIPGGSSSGSAVAVSDQMSIVALGTDTSGSCRIPAALCGIVGYKPTAARISTKGVYPLSFTLDSVGPMANTVSCCILTDAIMAGESPSLADKVDIRDLVLGVPEDYVLEDLDSHVSSSFEQALARLSKAGIKIERFRFELLNELTEINSLGGFAPAEAYAWHRKLLEKHEDLYDQRISSRIKVGAKQSAADYIKLCQERKEFIQRARTITAGFSFLAIPTVPVVAPAISDLDDFDDYRRINMLMLRNPGVVNFLDGCAISIPCHSIGQAPVGFMLVGQHGTDSKLFSASLSMEPIINPDLREYRD